MAFKSVRAEAVDGMLCCRVEVDKPFDELRASGEARVKPACVAVPVTRCSFSTLAKPVEALPRLLPTHIAWLAGALLAVAYPSLAERVYVSNEDGHSVSVIDATKSEVIATIEVGKRPRGMKLSRDGSRLYIAVSGLPKCPPDVPDEVCAKRERDLKADGIAVVDTAAHKLVRLINAGSDPEQFDLSRDGKRLFVANEDVATLSVVDGESGATIQRIAVGREPEGVGVSPDGRWVLVTNESDNAVSVIDTETLKVIRSVRVGQRPRDVAFTPDSRTAYVSGEFDASLYRIAVPSGDPVERVLQLRKEARPMAVVLDLERNRIYLSTGRGGTIAVIDATGSKLITEISVGTRPWGIALSTDKRRLYSANGPSNDVSVVDTTTLKAVRRIPVGRTPWGVVVGAAVPSSPKQSIAAIDMDQGTSPHLRDASASVSR